MLGWLRAIVDWIFGRPSSLIQLSLQAPNTYGAPRTRWEGPDPPKRPYVPDSPVRSPRRYGPTGRSAWLRSRNLWMTRAWWQLEDRTAAAEGLSAIKSSDEG